MDLLQLPDECIQFIVNLCIDTCDYCIYMNNDIHCGLSIRKLQSFLLIALS